MRVDTRREGYYVYNVHNIGRWWCDNRAQPHIRRMLWDGIDPYNIGMWWIERFNLDDDELEREICRIWSMHSGSTVPYVGRAGSSTQVRATRTARNIATAYSRLRMKRMAVPTVMSGGVRK